jgi:glycosyltransferase involved in cell wall biosynthesis
MSNNPKIVYIVTVPITAKYLIRGHLGYMREQGFDVTVISSPEPELAEVANQESISVLGIKIHREINFWADFVSLWQIYRALVKLKPDIVNASTPKAGFLGMLAAWFAGVPIRIYLLRGLRAETAVGLKKLILNTTERIASICAHYVVAVSQSLSLVYIQEKLVSPTKLIIIGSGSSNGVNPDRFLPNADTLDLIEQLRQDLNLTADLPTIGFVGRFTKDKGIVELISAFEIVQQSLPTVRLLLVGDFEAGDPLSPETVTKIKSNPAIILPGFVKDTALYYSLMNVFAFPSYREGFPNAPLEAALASIPTVGFSATGVVDAVLDGVTGTLVPLGNVDSLATELLKLLNDKSELHRLGEVARQRAFTEFQPPIIWSKWHDFYNKLMKQLACKDRIEYKE